MSQQDFPLIPDDLLQALDKSFPDRCPSIKDSDREVWFKAGARSVVNFLKQLQKTQAEKSLKG